MAALTITIRFQRVGVGISNTDVEYADSTSSTVAPTTGWQTTAPKWQNSHFIWTRTHITYTDNREQYSEPVCLPSGKGIASIVEQYYSSTSGQSLTGGYWSNSAFAWVNGRYIWTRSVIKYTDGTTETTIPICYTGSKGDKGDPGQPGKDGADGTSVNIKGTLSNAGLLPTSGATKGDGYIIGGDLWVYTGYTGSNDSKHQYGFENVGKIQGPQGKPGNDATQYYYHVAWCNTPDNSDGSFTVECSDGDAYAYMGTCIDTTKADPKTFNSYKWVKIKGDQGNPGKDAITISMSLTAIAHKKSATDAKYASEVKVYAGDKQVPFTFSHTSSDTRAVVSNVQKGDGRIFYVTIRAGAVVNGRVTISIAYGGKTYQRVISITTAEDGAPGQKGEVGATLRGPQDWSNMGAGYTFEAGGQGDEFKDVVVYNNNYYSCIKNHSKTATNYPGSSEDTNNGYWRVGKPMEMIATKVLLSTFSYIENLGARALEMKDEQGNVVFKAYNGNVTCTSGNFKNVTVTGTINATSGTIGGFDIQANQLHSAADGYSFDIYKDRLVYVDQRNQRTLSIMSSDDDGLALSMGAAKDNSQCYLKVGDRGIGLVSSNGKGFQSQYNERCMSVSNGKCKVEFYIDTSFGNLTRDSEIDAGILCRVNEINSKMHLYVAGLPTKATDAGKGEIYVENGILKLKS